MKKIFIAITMLVMSTSLLAAQTQYKIDEKEVVDGVSMRTGKHKKVRMYEGHNIKEYSAPIAQVVKSVMDFESRCNNKFKRKRKVVSKDFNCRNYNKNIIETIRVTDIKDKSLEKNEIQKFILKRFIYNRTTFRHNELVRVYKYKNKKKQTTYKITQTMLSDKESKKYLEDPISKDSAFILTKGEFIITEVAPNKTTFDYKYTSKTDHWLLNKSMVVSEFFENMSKGINRLFNVIEKETKTTALNEKVAPKKK
jgi:hypothetical protein